VTRVQWTAEIASRDLAKRGGVALRGVTRKKRRGYAINEVTRVT